MISGEDLEEVWERAITVARVELPNRCDWRLACGEGGCSKRAFDYCRAAKCIHHLG